MLFNVDTDTVLIGEAYSASLADIEEYLKDLSQ
jgi:hypothetical protein